MDRFDICIIGAGVVGLAIARQLALSPRYQQKNIVLLEQEHRFGSHTSSRNSEVIHAGLYYTPGSLKARLCVRGKALLYQYCDDHDVSYKKVGKYIVARDEQRDALAALKANAEVNGVDDLCLISGSELAKREAAVTADCALHCPSTGIIDSHSYMQALLNDAQAAGLLYSPRSAVTGISVGGAGSSEHIIETLIDGKQDYQFQARILINSAGLSAQHIARLMSLPGSPIPKLHYCKGDYFSYQGPSPFSSLIYPFPRPNSPGLGIHSTLDMGGAVRFGPDAHYVDEIHYDIDTEKAQRFADAIRAYYPNIEAARLIPAYSGIRPKLTSADQAAADFIIRKEAASTAPIIQLFGIESPGLTASLAIAEHVEGLCN